MSDLIDREALLKRLHDAGGCGAPPESWADGYDKAIDLAYGMAENAPTIDPVHAAGGCYCRECKHLLRDLSSREYHMCMRLRLPQKVDLDDFCSYGQRREDTK